MEEEQATVKKKAPVQVTGGGGFRYENPVAARFLLDLLSGSNALGVEFGRVNRVDWQVRDSGWLADDLLISCKHSTGDRAAGVSIKSAQQVTRNGFPDDFVNIAWAQWLGFKTDRKLSDSNDAIALITGSLTHDIQDAWTRLLSQALDTTAERVVSRLSEPIAAEGSQSSALQRVLFKSLTCPTGLQGHADTDQNATVDLLRRVRLLHFDFESIPSRDHARALADCQSALVSGDASESEKLWLHLNAIADQKRTTGGSIDLPTLLAELRATFDLRGHPDYRHDWEMLERSSQELMADTRTQIADLPPLARATEHATIQNCLNEHRACLLVGESGCGKSALAKGVGQACYARIVWIAGNALDYDTAAQFEGGINIRHALVEVLTALPQACLVVFDGIERYSPRGLRLACRFIEELLTGEGRQHIHVLATAPFEAADRLIRRFVEFGVPSPLHNATTIARPSEVDVQNLVASIAGLQWASLRPELRPLLTNLKILDWVVAATRSGTSINDSSFNGLTNLIDALWERWIEADGEGLSRSHVLMRLGVLEADTLISGTQRMQLEHSEQTALAGLVASNLIRIRDERVYFSHDLLGDWARMRVLVGEQSIASPANRDRANLPRWHRAVRLLGQRLLEQSSDGSQRWQRAIEELGDSSQTGVVIRDLFLESLFLATNAAVLLERSWTALIANDGGLLNRMLNRFLFAATLPDPRFANLIQGEADGGQWEHLARIPYWPYWGPVLTILHAHRDDVVKLVPHTAAKVCSLWLRLMPTELMPGQPMPWRQEAAELSVAIGREIQALNAEGNYYSAGQDKHAYEALLWAAPELPDEVAALCLEIAERRDLSPEIRLRVDQTHERRREERRQWLAANPEREPAPAHVLGFHGRLREPWPDGPRDRVDTGFQEACLDTGAFTPLLQARPAATREILLAICIEEPQHDDYSNRSMRECGVAHWHTGDPPLWCRGPFFQFLRQAPEDGLSFVVTLVNFASRQYAENENLTVIVGDEPQAWYGDSNVFRWHHDWPLLNGASIHCSLMALERWLYEQVDRGENIDHWLDRILKESESLAFAGLLFDVGKRQPALFAGVLKPLLSNWVLIDWDRQVTIMRQRQPDPMGYWALQPTVMIQLGRQWYGMPHRRDLLIYLGGGIVRTMIGEEQNWPFLQKLRADWTRELDSNAEPESLRLLIERFNPANYTFDIQDGKQVPVGFQWPDTIARQNAEDMRRLSEQSTVTNLPHRCREILNAAQPLPQGQVLLLWEFLQGVESTPPRLARDGEPLLHIEDVVCGGVAVLLVLHHDWLAEDPARVAWCRRKLENVIQQPPTPFRFDSETASGDRQWDSFAAEAGIFLFARDRSDLLARALVATGILSFHYSTTARTMDRASRCRDKLAEDFDRMLGLAVRWAGLRAPYSLATRPQFDTRREGWNERKQALIRDFVDQRLPIDIPDIKETSATADAEIEAVLAEQSPALARTRTRSRGSRRGGRSRESFYPESLRLDSHVITAAFAWLDLREARSDERAKWLSFIRNFLDIALSSVPHIDDPRQQEIEGLPNDFDGWVFGIVANAIPSVTTGEDARSLWQPILDLGSAAHNWVERFFWYWFTDGLRASQTPEQFTRLWSAMIQHALESSAWDPNNNRSYDLDGMVCELLGFDTRMNKLGLNPAFASAVEGMERMFASAAQRWFVMPKVVTGFLNFATQPATAGLLLPGIRWLAIRVPSFDSYDWKYGLEESLIAFLHVSWEREHDRISSDPPLQAAFLSLLACVVSRGGHAAIALRDRVVTFAAS